MPGTRFGKEKWWETMRHLGKIGILLILLFLLSTPLLWGNSREAHEHEESGEMIEISVLSGLVTLILLISTVTAGRLMKKGRMAVKTHHTLAYITLLVALSHGIYNFFAH
jgi:nitrate reductase gamma subunit